MDKNLLICDVLAILEILEEWQLNLILVGDLVNFEARIVERNWTVWMFSYA